MRNNGQMLETIAGGAFLIGGTVALLIVVIGVPLFLLYAVVHLLTGWTL